jgi:hypothetical protein
MPVLGWSLCLGGHGLGWMLRCSLVRRRQACRQFLEVSEDTRRGRLWSGGQKGHACQAAASEAAKDTQVLVHRQLRLVQCRYGDMEGAQRGIPGIFPGAKVAWLGELSLGTLMRKGIARRAPPPGTAGSGYGRPRPEDAHAPCSHLEPSSGFV